MTLPFALLLGAVAVFLVVADRGGGHTAANRAQLKSACAGLLPYDELSGLVPDEVEGEVSQYGSVLEPGEESRSLVNCAVTWPGHGSVRVRAAALVSAMPMSVEVEDIEAGAEEESYEVPGLTGRVGEDGRAWIVAKCPDGPALFTLRVADDRDGAASSPGLAYERAALRAFAERSAKAHGCSVPVTA